MSAAQARNGVVSEYRYAPIPEDLLYDKALSDKAVRVYGCLMRHGLTKDDCYPSHRRIATLIGCAQRSVQRPLVELEEAGWIERIARFDATGERVSDGFMVRTSSAPPAQENAVPPRDDARTPRAEERAQEGKPENESQGTSTAALAALADEPVPFLDEIAATARGTRLPAFLVSLQMHIWASNETPGVDVTSETRRFADYWRAVAGQRGTKLDWYATWRNWMRRAHDDLPKTRAGKPSVQADHEDRVERFRKLTGEAE